MATAASPLVLAAQARRFYLELLLREISRVVNGVTSAAKEQAAEVGLAADQQAKRRELSQELSRAGLPWQQALLAAVRQLFQRAAAEAAGQTTRAPAAGGDFGGLELSLVDNDTVELEIISSRMSLAMMDKASSEFADLRYRITTLEKRGEMDQHDVMRSQVLAKAAIEAWREAGLTLDQWRQAQGLLNQEFTALILEAYQATNQWLVSQGVCPEVNPRAPVIRRASDAVTAAPAPASASRPAAATRPATPTASATSARAPLPGSALSAAEQYAPTALAEFSQRPGARTSEAAPSGAEPAETGTGAPTGPGAGPGVYDETRMLTRPGPMYFNRLERAQAVMGNLNQLVAQQVPDFIADDTPAPQASGALKAAMQAAQVALERCFEPVVGSASAAPVGTAGLLRELQQNKQALKEAATTPGERAAVEIVALMFQSLLIEERIPSAVRVWFARLQMPVMRVALAEPGFFSEAEHPARTLIDRMGACVMGFQEGSQGVSEALEAEVRRVVQVIEAYPDAGRKVFQGVLAEFEEFLTGYFKSGNQVSGKGVSLAEQIEERETLVVQYTIELRKMLNEVPVHEDVREFLFRVWADVMATTAVKSGAASAAAQGIKRAAADLIWLASAKSSKEERAEAVRRLLPLLKVLREGMASASVPLAKQNAHIQTLNQCLTAAFLARAATIPSEQLTEITRQIESFEAQIADLEDFELDESLMRDLSGHETEDLEVVSEGGSMPTPDMLAWVREMPLGGWFKLDYRNRIDTVQLAWQGMRKQLNLFVNAKGRGVMFQQRRLAAFLQAGLLLPLEEETLTARATRDALAKLDADPSRLLR